MGALLVIYLLLSIMVANWAAKRGRDFWTIFFISIAISPLMVIVSLWRKSPLLKE